MLAKVSLLELTPKYLINILLSIICLLSPIIYVPYGGNAEFILFGYVIFVLLVSVFGLYQGRTLAQGMRERRGQLLLDSLNHPSLWGAWIGVVGVLISWIPMPIAYLDWLSKPSFEAWTQLKSLLDSAEVTHSLTNMFSISLSPAQSFHWCVLQLCWIALVYLAMIIRGQRKMLLWALIALAPAITVIGLFHSYFNISDIYNYFPTFDRVQLQGFVTPLVNPNHSASLLMLSGLVSLGIKEQLKADQHARHKQLLCTLSFGFSILGVMLTSSRAAWVIYAYTLSLWGLRNYLKWRRFRQLLFAGSACLFVLIPIIIVSLTYTSLSQTIDLTKGQIWIDSLGLISDSWPLGIGNEAFGEVFTRYQTFNRLGWVSHPENMFIQRLAEAGIIGLISMLIYGWTWVKWWQSESLQTHSVALSLGLGVTAVALHQQFDFGLDRLNVIIVLALAWGLMWSYQPSLLTRFTEDEFRRNRRAKSRWTKCVLQITIFTLCLFSLTISLKLMNPPLRKVINEYELNQGQAALISAIEVHPLSAHLMVRIATFNLPNKGDWLHYTHQVAPRWGTPLIMQARELHRMEQDELAAVNYRQVLSSHPELRDLIFSDLFKSPLSISLGEWLPSQYLYSFYVQYRQLDIEKANQVLGEIDRALILSDSSLRSLYIRFLLPTCAHSTLNEVFNTKQTTDGGSIQRNQENAFNQTLLKIDQITVIYGLKLCAKTHPTQSLESLYANLGLDDLPSSLENEVKRRQKLGLFSIGKVLKNSSFVDAE